ncbi:MAG: recombinase family protein [Pseudomonadota bacterium]
MILNELYAGKLVWNRVRMVKDPDTGRRISRPNPPSEWKRAEVQHLAIIDRSLFDEAQERKHARSITAPQKQRKSKYLLSGLLKCGLCGGGIVVKDRDHGRVRIHCSTMREAGSCKNRRVLYMDEVEKAVLSGLKTHLKAPHLLREFADAYQTERQRLAGEKRRRRGRLQTRVGEIKRLLDRAWDDYAAERMPTDIIGARMKELSAEQKAVEAELASEPAAEKVIGLHPGALRQYERCVSDLATVFGGGITENNAEAAEKLRKLIARVTLIPDSDGLRIELQGHLARLLDAPELFPNMRIASSGGTVVAEEGLEPPTRGL